MISSKISIIIGTVAALSFAYYVYYRRKYNRAVQKHISFDEILNEAISVIKELHNKNGFTSCELVIMPSMVAKRFVHENPDVVENLDLKVLENKHLVIWYIGNGDTIYTYKVLLGEELNKDFIDAIPPDKIYMKKFEFN